jgi:branched-chain amino acid transport system permease protein
MIYPPRVKAWMMNVAILLTLCILWPVGSALQNNLEGYVVDIIIHAGIAITLAVSLNLINGITGQFSLGHAGFMALGAYTGGVLFKHYAHNLGPIVTPAFFVAVTLLGGIIAAVAGIIVGAPTLRLKGDYLAIATLGFGEIITVVLNQIDHIGSFEVGGSAGLHNIPSYTNFFWTYAWALICVVAIARLVYSAKGKPFFAVREDEIAAAAMGVDTTFYKVAAFIIGAFFAGVAGVLTALLSGNIDPGAFNFVRSIEIVVMVVLGGSGSITGAILAAIILTILPEFLRPLQDWRLVIYALILILMMLVRPEGVLGNRELWITRRRQMPRTGIAPATGTS